MEKTSAKDIDFNDLIEAVVRQESAGRSNAVSDAGAVGLMQIMPGTADEIAKELGIEDYDLYDAETNRKFGTYYLKKLMSMFNNDPELALTAYHSGPNRVKRLLEYSNGSSLADILSDLGPVGRRYAKEVLAKLNKKKSVEV